MSQKYLDAIQFKNENLKVRDTEARQLIQDNSNDIASLKPRVDQTEREIAGLKDRVAVTEQDIDMLEGRMTVVETKNNEQDAEINEIQAEQTDQNTRLSAVEAKNSQQDTRIASLESNENTIFDEISGIKAKNDEQDTYLAQLNGRMSTAEGEITTINNTIVTINDTIDNIIYKNNEQDAQIEDLDRRIVASTYEAGEGIYFGQGVDHTNINVEDELLDEIHNSTAKNIEQDERLNDIEENAVYNVEVVTGDTKKLKVVGKTDDIKNTINGTVTSTPSGSVSSSFTGSQMSLTGTPSGSVSSSGTFTGDQMTLSGTPSGSVSSSASGTAVVLSAGTLPSKAADSHTPSSCVYDSQTETIYFTPDSFTEGAFNAGTFPAVQSVTDPTISSTFTGNQSSFTGTPSGTVAVSSSFTGDQMSLTGTPSGTVASSFTGAEATNDVIFADGGSIQPLTLVASPASTQENPVSKNIHYTQTQSLTETFTFTTNRAVRAVFISEISTVAYGGSYSSYISISSQLPARVNDTTYTVNVIYRTAAASTQLTGSWKTQKITLEAIDEYGQTAYASAYLKVTVT